MNEALLDLTIILIRGMVILLIALGIATALRNRSATTHNFLWRLVFLTLIVIPFLGFISSPWSFRTPELPPLEMTMKAMPQSVPVTKLPPLVVNEASSTAPSTSPISWQASLIGLWAIGLLFIVARFLYGYFKLIGLRRQCQLLDEDSPWRQSLADRQPFPIKIFSGDDIPVPLIFGLWRPSMLIPSHLLKVSPHERSLILHHEIAHAKRRDGLFNLVRALATAIHWPNPLAWIAAKHLRLSEEEAVDDQVLESGCQPALYARLLSQVAAGGSFPTTAQAMAQPSTLRARVTRLLDTSQERRAPGNFLRRTLVAFFTSFIVLLVTLNAQDNKQDWVTEAYIIVPERWTQATIGLESVENPAMALLERGGINLKGGASAIYDSEVQRMVTRAPRELSEKIAQFLAKEFQAIPQSTFHVRIDYRLITSPQALKQAGFVEQTAPGTSIRGVLSESQLNIALDSWTKQPDVNLLASPSVITRSGQRAEVQVGEIAYLSVLPRVDGDGQHVTVELSFDPPEVERRATFEVTLKNSSTVIYGKGNTEAHVITATIIQPDKPSEIPKKVAKKDRTIILDAGHGGRDEGFVVGNAIEKTLTLDFTRLLRRVFEDKHFDVVLTRQTDTYTTLAERVQSSNAINNGIFLSLHFNGSKRPILRGFETYYASPRDGEAPRKESERLANAVQTSLQDTIGEETRSRGIRTANFKVLQESQHPAIMVEGAFLSNADDLTLVQSPAFLERLAHGIVDGVLAFDE